MLAPQLEAPNFVQNKRTANPGFEFHVCKIADRLEHGEGRDPASTMTSEWNFGGIQLLTDWVDDFEG
jgi:hypothetical protein